MDDLWRMGVDVRCVLGMGAHEEVQIPAGRLNGGVEGNGRGGACQARARCAPVVAAFFSARLDINDQFTYVGQLVQQLQNR